MISELPISSANEFGVLEVTRTDVVAQHGRSYAAIKIARGNDGFYRYGLDLMYSYGGFGWSPHAADDGYATVNAATEAAIDELLRRWPKAFCSEPQSVREELSAMRSQAESHLRQPSLF
jgi:hypothetical protein